MFLMFMEFPTCFVFDSYGTVAHNLKYIMFVGFFKYIMFLSIYKLITSDTDTHRSLMELGL